MAWHNKFKVTEEELRAMYLDRKMSIEEICAATGNGEKTVRVYLIKYGITNNVRGGQVRFAGIEKETLRRLYVEERKSLKETAAALGCSTTTIFKKLQAFGLQVSLEERFEQDRAHQASFVHDRPSAGYRWVKRPEHPMASQSGYVQEHRVNAESFMGVSLKTENVVHHINFCKRDNSIENLAVLPNQAVHRQIHDYMARIGAHAVGLTDAPEAFQFKQPVFWGGQWITSIDLMKNVRAASARQTGTEKPAEEAPAVTIN